MNNQMSVAQIKQSMLSMSVNDLDHIIHIAKQIKSISATATFEVGQNVFVVQKSKKTAGKIIKMNDKKAIVEMVYGRAAAVSQVSVPYGMLEVNNAMNGQVTSF
tara:strand:+ start:395 stop:706 length:312 start_codon:yes stop_codon:yes gene_type:complete